MNFIRRLLKKNSPSPKTFAQAQRSPRVYMSALHRLTFKPAEPKLPHVNHLSNISTGGMALILPEDKTPLIHIGDTVTGLLTIDKKEFEIAGRIRHLSQKLMGCEFNEPSNDLREAVGAYLRVEISALRLRKVNEAYMKADPRGTAIWFSDGRQGEFYGVSAPNGVVYFHMSFLGYYVEGGVGLPARGGLIKDDDHRENHDNDPVHKGSDFVELSAHLSPEVAALAQRFVQNIEGMPTEIAQNVTQQLDAKI